jgi:ABC-2 type transport system ATP-binding protein
MSTELALETDDLGHRYRSLWAVRHCDLALAQGRVVGLVGPNGAGKTTLLRLVAGLLEPAEGHVRVLGQPCAPGSSESLARVGYVGQDSPLYRRFRVRDLLAMGRHLNLRWNQPLVEARLEALSIPLDRRAGELSGGEQSQVALALALAKEPELLLLDEPLANLDPLARREFMQTLMQATADNGRTAILSSHLITDLERVCDYLVLIRRGHIELAGDIDDLLAAHRLMSGPRSDVADGLPGLVHIVRGDRQSHAVVRTNGASVATGWETRPVDLEELVLAYLQRPSTTEAVRP